MKLLEVIMLLIVSSSSNQQIQSTENKEHCGQYGFRCVDRDSYQICTYADLDGVTDAPEIVRMCLDNNVCDEDNIAYCTPLDLKESGVIVKPPKIKYGEENFGKRSSSGIFSRKTDVLTSNNSNGLRHYLNLRKSDNANPFDFNNDYDDVVTTTSKSSVDYPSLKYELFECEEFGYFPGIQKKKTVKDFKITFIALIISRYQ